MKYYSFKLLYAYLGNPLLTHITGYCEDSDRPLSENFDQRGK